jgi:protein-tyrosine-phosphatase
MAKDRVLFVDTDGARSLIAAAILREHASDRFEAWCAAVEPRPVDSRVLDVLRQHGASTKRLFVLPLEDVVEEFRFVIVLATFS